MLAMKGWLTVVEEETVPGNLLTAIDPQYTRKVEQFDMAITTKKVEFPHA